MNCNVFGTKGIRPFKETIWGVHSVSLLDSFTVIQQNCESYFNIHGSIWPQLEE